VPAAVATLGIFLLQTGGEKMARQHHAASSIVHPVAQILRRTLAVASALLLLPGVAPAAVSATPKVLVDFENTTSLKLTPVQAKIGMTQLAGKPALEITTEAAAPYPGVCIEPRDGKWNLTGFDGVEMDVFNPEDSPVRVLLSVSNPGADGRNRCNAESVTVPRRGKATLVLPFGFWYGENNHPLDLANVVAAQVMLDRAGRSRRFMVKTIRAVKFERPDMQAIAADPFFQQLQPAFGRGVNLGNALESPHEGDWGVVLKEEYFDRIKSAGFDAVRIPVCWPAHAADTPPYRIDPKFFDRVDWAIKQALQRRIVPIVNMHNYDGLVQDPDKHRARFLAMWQQIAEHYKNYPRALAFELFNEPFGQLTADEWNQLAAAAIKIIRRTNPTREIVVGPVAWNSIKELKNLELPADDRHLVVTVHYYEPFHFTHQGASWVGPESPKWLGTKWTGTPAERQAIEHDFDTAIAWAVKHHRPLWLGEFGAYSKADLASRARWTQFVAEAALKRKMGFAYWEFCAGFGIYDPVHHEWIEPLKDALLPKSK
jgi:aryl-phospho-beta-D-glucosidase BglC (GH1 family)